MADWHSLEHQTQRIIFSLSFRLEDFILKAFLFVVFHYNWYDFLPSPPFEGGEREVVTVFISNIQKQKIKRKLLRNNATPQEVVLWSRLRNSQLGVKFRRQASIGNFIADFYCPVKKLVVEVDGSQHIDNELDKERTKFLNVVGVTVLRFWNNEIDENLDGVIMKIITTLNPSFERREGEKT